MAKLCGPICATLIGVFVLRCQELPDFRFEP